MQQPRYTDRRQHAEPQAAPVEDLAKRVNRPGVQQKQRREVFVNQLPILAEPRPDDVESRRFSPAPFQRSSIPESLANSLRALWITTAVYAVLVISLLSYKPLWLDEMLTLVEVRLPTTAEMIRELPAVPGSSPLTFLEQRYLLNAIGFSKAKARLPAAVFGIASVFAAGLLALRLGMRRPWIAAALLAIFPLTLRYSVEARPYSQGLFLSLVSTLVFLQLKDRPTLGRAALYALALALAAYSQAFAASVMGAHILWAVWQRQWRASAYAGGAAAIAVGLFLPWVIWSKASWMGGIVREQSHFSFTPKLALVISRELIGGGHVGTVVVLTLAGVCLARRRLESRSAWLLVLLVVITFAGGLVTDAAFSYFFAIRQFLWILPALAILAGAEITRGGKIAAALAVVLIFFCVRSSVLFLKDQHENWETASHAIAAEVKDGACLVTPPDGTVRLYRFFEPALPTESRTCSKMVVANSSYTLESDRRALFAQLDAQGYVTRSTREVGGVSIVVLTMK